MKYTVSPMKITNDNIYFMSETEMDLVDFLLKDMGDKRLSPADITKRSGLSASQVSKVLNRESPAGMRALECFANALNIPVEVLVRYAKNPSRQTMTDERRQELIHLFDMMNEDNKDDQISYARMRLEKQEREAKNSVRRPRTSQNL